MTYRHTPSTGRTRMGPPLRIGIAEESPRETTRLAKQVAAALRELESRRADAKEEAIPLFLAASGLSHCVRRRADGALTLVLGNNDRDGGLALTLIQPDGMIQVGELLISAGRTIKEIWAERCAAADAGNTAAAPAAPIPQTEG